MRTYRHGHKLIVDNLQLEIFTILQNKLDYTYCRKSGKEYFLKENYPDYLIKDIDQLKDDLIDYIKNNFDQLGIEENVTLEEILNVVYRDRPVTKVYARNFLGSNSEVMEDQYRIEENMFVII